MKKIQKIINIAILVWSIGPLWANNVQITNGPRIVSRSMNDKQIKVRFDLSWDNSWNLNFPGNWDAAWVFMKYKLASNVGGDFRHAYLVKAPDIVKGGGTVAAQGYGESTMLSSETGTATGRTVVPGVFLYRKDKGSGTTEFKDVELVWDINETGVDSNSVLSIRVFAIEMVYVPEGAFYIGDNNSYGRLQCLNDRMWDHSRSSPCLSNNVDNTKILDKEYTPLVSPRMGNNSVTTAEGTYISSNNFGNNAYYHFYGGHPASYYISYNTNAWSWVQIQLPKAQKATWGYFQTYHGTSSHSTYYIARGFYVTGSNDGVTWYNVHGDNQLDPKGSSTKISGFQQFSTALIRFDNPREYQYYRFNYWGYAPHVTEIQIFGSGDSLVNKINSEKTLQFFTRQENDFQNFSAYKDSISQAFPKGYKAFYCMKHELTQATWVDFMNCLSVSQQQRLSPISLTADVGTCFFPQDMANHRMTIRLREKANHNAAVFGCSVDGKDWNSETNGGNVPMFNLAWTDITAYLAWAALRPMTELEYEKACRGDQKIIEGEYAWGSLSYVQATSLDSVNSPVEDPLPATANSAYIGNVNRHNPAYKLYWPVRSGSFAKEESIREDAGASYWGIMNLTDNVPERVINVSTSQGRAYTGLHGWGYINAGGLSNVYNWPSQQSAIGTGANQNAIGTGYRGIPCWQTTNIGTIYPVSYRGGIEYASVDYNYSNAWRYYFDQNFRDGWTGCRGVRTAPEKE